MISACADAGCRTFTISLVVLLSVLAIVLGALAWSMPYDIDELDQLHTAYLYSRGMEPMIHFIDHPFIQCYKWTLGQLIPVMGDNSIIVYRWLSVALGLIALGVFALAVKKIMGATSAIFATTFLGISLPFLYRIHQMRSDAFVLVFLALSVAFLSGALCRKTSLSLVGAGIFAGLASAYRPSLVAYPFAVALALLFFSERLPQRRQVKRFVIFSAPAALAAAIFFAIPYRLSTILSLEPVIGAARNMLLQEDAVSPAGFWRVGVGGMILLFIVAISVVHFIVSPLVTHHKKQALFTQCLLAAVLSYSLIIFTRKICFAQDILFLIFFAAPFVGILFERMNFYGRYTSRRWVAGLLISALMALVIANSLAHQKNNYGHAHRHSPEVKQVVYRHLFSDGLDSTIPVRKRIFPVAPVIHRIFGAESHITPAHIKATKEFFMRAASDDEYCFSSDSSHLFRLNPPSFTPPTLMHHTIWTPGAFDQWIKFSDKYFQFIQPLAKKHDMLMWGLNGLSPDERILSEFKNTTPTVILLDSPFLNFMGRYPSLKEFIGDNYEAVYLPSATRIFGVHRILGADVLKHWKGA